jgi:hypothetical protein
MSQHPCVVDEISKSSATGFESLTVFMDRSKTAVAAGDLERGNNLAMKARLLSDELVKPKPALGNLVECDG